jgi:hypothetical protein
MPTSTASFDLTYESLLENFSLEGISYQPDGNDMTIGSISSSDNFMPIGVLSKNEFESDIDLSLSFYPKLQCVDISLFLFKANSTWFWGTNKDVIKLQISCGYLSLHGQNTVMNNFDSSAIESFNWYTLRVSHQPSLNVTYASVHSGKDSSNTNPLIRIGPMSDALTGKYKFGFNGNVLAKYRRQQKTKKMSTNSMDSAENSELKFSDINLSYKSQSTLPFSTKDSSSNIILISSLISSLLFMAILAIVYRYWRAKAIVEIDPNKVHVQTAEYHVRDQVNPILNPSVKETELIACSMLPSLSKGDTSHC